MGWLNRYWQADEDQIACLQSLYAAGVDDEVETYVSIVDGAE